MSGVPEALSALKFTADEVAIVGSRALAALDEAAPIGSDLARNVLHRADEFDLLGDLVHSARTVRQCQPASPAQLGADLLAQLVRERLSSVSGVWALPDDVALTVQATRRAAAEFAIGRTSGGHLAGDLHTMAHDIRDWVARSGDRIVASNGRAIDVAARRAGALHPAVNAVLERATAPSGHPDALSGAVRRLRLMVDDVFEAGDGHIDSAVRARVELRLAAIERTSEALALQEPGVARASGLDRRAIEQLSSDLLDLASDLQHRSQSLL